MSLDKLRAHQPEALIDTFVPLADFQTPEQSQAFRVVGPHGDKGNALQPSTFALPLPADRADRGLATLLTGPGDFLVCDVGSLQSRGATGDWRDFGTLLVALYAPAEGADLVFYLAAGDADTPSWSQTIRAVGGWNYWTLDLDEIGRHVDLGRVRTLAWRLGTGGRPATIYLDDLALANPTRWLFGQDAGPGRLYAFSRGRHLFVGARQRFELVLSDGVITGWYEGTGENLTAPPGLGPWPTWLSEDWFTRSDLAPGVIEALRADARRERRGGTQRLVEASELRLVVESEPVAIEPPATVSVRATDPACYRYTLYPDGRLYVLVVAPAAPSANPASQLGWALALNGRSDFRVAAQPPGDPDHAPAPFFLVPRSGPPQADLFWTTARADEFRRRRDFLVGGQEPLWLIAGGAPGGPADAAAHLIRLWSPTPGSAAEVEPVAADYQQPARLQVTSGEMVTDALGDLDHDGYNESEGCYELRVQAGVLRFAFDPGELVRVAPLFRVRGTAGQRCWVYVDGQAIRDESRDAADELLFVLSGPVRSPRYVELHVRPAGNRAASRRDRAIRSR